MTLMDDETSSAPMTVTPATPRDRVADDLHDMQEGRSSFVAFLMGGVVVAGGLLAFLYYDTGTGSRGDELTTGSIIRTPALSAPNVHVQLAPARNDGNTAHN